jgi:peroxiredoxin
MRHRALALASALLLAVTPARAAPLGAVEPIPSYQDAVLEFQARRAQAGGPSLDSAERALLERSAAELAARSPEPGLPVGIPAPDFALVNAFGREVRLSDLTAQGPVVLTFYRGAWCPYCNLQLRGLEQILPYIESAGARLVAVTPQKPDKSRAQVAAEGYPFEILSDLDDQVMKAYDLYFEVPEPVAALYRDRLDVDLTEYNGEGRAVLPVPATFVIDRHGVIRAAFADTDYRKRPEPAAILAALLALDRP